jgi:hypothetical protein
LPYKHQQIATHHPNTGSYLIGLNKHYIHLTPSQAVSCIKSPMVENPSTTIGTHNSTVGQKQVIILLSQEKQAKLLPTASGIQTSLVGAGYSQ